MDYWPDVIQVIPTPDYKVYIYFDDGTIRLYDAVELVDKGVFKPLKDIKVFMETCTVLSHTLAWTLLMNQQSFLKTEASGYEKNRGAHSAPLRVGAVGYG